MCRRSGRCDRILPYTLLHCFTVTHLIEYPDQVLLLLHGSEDPAVLGEDLADWIEHPRLSDFRSKVLTPLHKKRMIEWDRETDTIAISPLGVKRVEERLLSGKLG